MAQQSPPLTRRQVLAALAAASCALLLSGFADAMRHHAVSLALLTLCGGWMDRWARDHLTQPGLALSALALLLTLPAVALGAWMDSWASMDGAIIEPTQGAAGLLDLAARARAHVAVLLLSGGTGLALLVGRRGLALWSALLVGGMVGGLEIWLLRAADEALVAGRTEDAVRWTRMWLPLAALIPLAAGLARLLQRRWQAPGTRSPHWLSTVSNLLMVGLVIWAALPPVLRLTRGYTPEPPARPLPPLQAGETVLLPTVDPLSPALEQELLAQRVVQAHRRPWHCVTEPLGRRPWRTRGRRTVALALPEQGTCQDLERGLEALETWGVHRVALRGRAQDPGGPLGPLLAAPMVTMVLNRAPLDARWGVLDAQGLDWIGEEPVDADCALAIDPALPLSTAMATLRELTFGEPPACGVVGYVPWEAVPQDRSALPALGCERHVLP